MKDVVRKLVRELLGERATTTARRGICTWWRVEVFDGDGRLVASELDKNLRTAYARIAIRLRALVATRPPTQIELGGQP